MKTKILILVSSLCALRLGAASGCPSFDTAPLSRSTLRRGPTAIAAGDFNGDGLMDAIVAHDSSTDLSLFFGLPSGQLGDAQIVDSGLTISTSISLQIGGVAVADFDGDGHVDIVATAYDLRLSLLRGRGDGSFEPAEVTERQSLVRTLSVADVDGDGRPDILGLSRQGFAWVAHPGAPPLVDHPEAAFPGGLTGFTTGDFNHDGLPDVAYGALINFSVALNDGAGGFAPPTNFPVSGQVASMSTGDLNGDGHADLAVSINRQNQTSISMLYTGDGQGGFEEWQTLEIALPPGPPGASTVTGTRIADLDGDGRADLAVVDGFMGSIHVFRGQPGSPPLPDAGLPAGGLPIDVVATDVFGTGSVDLIVLDQNAGVNDDRGSVTLLRGRPATPPAPQREYFVADGPTNMVIADFDGDGVPDLAAGSIGYAVSMLRGRSDGTFDEYTPLPETVLPTYPVSLVTADFNRDGRPDLAWIDALGNLRVHLMGGPGFAGQDTILSIASLHTRELATGDFDGDGWIDLVVAGSVGLIPIRNSLGGWVRQPTIPISGGEADSLAVADFNGDGHLDVVVGSFHASSVTVFPGTGDGAFGEGVVTALPSAETQMPIAVADFDRDGRPDLAVVSPRLRLIRILLNDGDGRFGLGDDVQLYAGPVHVAAVDLDGDGLPDLAAALKDSHAVAIRLGDGHGGFRDAGDIVVTAEPVFLVPHDFDGNGRIDLAVLDSRPDVYVGSVNILVNECPSREIPTRVAPRPSPRTVAR